MVFSQKKYRFTVGKLDWIKIKDDFDSSLCYIANNGNVFYFDTNLNAPKTKVVRYDLDRPVSLLREYI